MKLLSSKHWEGQLIRKKVQGHSSSKAPLKHKQEQIPFQKTIILRYFNMEFIETPISSLKYFILKLESSFLFNCSNVC